MTDVNLRNLIGKLNPMTRNAVEAAAGLTTSRTHYSVDMEHLLAKLLELPDGDVPIILRHFGVDRTRASQELARSLDTLKRGNSGPPAISRSLINVLVNAWTIGSINYNEPVVRTGLVLLAWIADDEFAPAVRNVSKELQKIEPHALRTQFATILAGSKEVEKTSKEPQPEEADNSGNPSVFICHRNDETESYADRLHDRFIAALPGVRVFQNADSLRFGTDFPEKIATTIRKTDVVVVMIGETWLSKDEKGNRRLDDPRDYVRLQVAAALRERKLVVPCLVEGAQMPRPDDLPSGIIGLADKHGFQVSHTNFRPATEQLMPFLKTLNR